MTSIKEIIKSQNEDLTTTEDNVAKLATKLLLPIDKIRSIATPANVSSTIVADEEAIISKNLSFSVDTTKLAESRVNAFYRSIGLPVMEPSGQFYNHGFDPEDKTKIKKHEAINNKLLTNTALMALLQQRELQPLDSRAKFLNQDINAIVYAMLLRHIKPFLVAKADVLKEPFDLDQQKFTIKERTEEIKSRESVNDVKFVAGLNGGTHILKPFIVNPRVADTVMPQNNIICAPFLPDRNSTIISADVPALRRPYIEYVCRLRLKQKELDPAFFKEVERILTGSTSAEDSRAVADIRDAVVAILDDNKISGGGSKEVLETIKNFSAVQLSVITNYIKTIKVLVRQLYSDLNDINYSVSIGVVVTPSDDGPENPNKNAKVTSVGFGDNTIDANIARLKLEQNIELYRSKISANYLISGSSTGDISALFLGPPVAEIKRDLSADIAKLESLKNSIGRKILDSMANVERITGDVSGLGLIDVLAMYVALWSVDIKTLLNLLDDDAINRLYTYNREFQGSLDVQARKNSSADGLTALKELETKIFNVLSFADKLLTKIQKTPNEFEDGSPI